MKIEKKDDLLIVTFPYSPSSVEALREVPGRRFNPAKKQWEIPAANVKECMAALVPLGFIPSWDVKRHAASFAARQEAYEEWKITPPQSYCGGLPLYDFQRKGAEWLAAMPGALLADSPGLGKTIQTLAACERMNRILVLCPASLKYSWKDEIEKWETARVSVLDGVKEKRVSAWKDGTAKYVVANYELLLHDFDEMPKEWDAIVCDEATRIQNPDTQTTKNLKKLIAQKKIALTGTPVSNSPADLFSIIDWLSPGFLGTFWQFKRRYCVVDARFPSRIIGFQHMTEFKEKVSPFILRRLKEEVFSDFPAKTVQDIPIELTPDEWELYERVRLRILEEYRELKINTKSLVEVPVKILRLKQITSHPQLISDVKNASKFGVCEDRVREITQSGDKVLIFTQFKEMAKILFDSLWVDEECGKLVIHGDTPPEKRQQIVRLFNEEPFYKVLIMTEAGAYGLNLQAASYVIHYDLPWSVSKLEQREGRAHRIGNQKPVTVYNLMCRKTVDEYVAKVLHKKQKLSLELLHNVEKAEDAAFGEADYQAILESEE